MVGIFLCSPAPGASGVCERQVRGGIDDSGKQQGGPGQSAVVGQIRRDLSVFAAHLRPQARLERRRAQDQAG